MFGSSWEGTKIRQAEFVACRLSAQGYILSFTRLTIKQALIAPGSEQQGLEFLRSFRGSRPREFKPRDHVHLYHIRPRLKSEPHEALQSLLATPCGQPRVGLAGCTPRDEATQCSPLAWFSIDRMFKFNVTSRPQRPYGYLRTGSPGWPPRLSDISKALSGCIRQAISNRHRFDITSPR